MGALLQQGQGKLTHFVFANLTQLSMITTCRPVIDIISSVHLNVTTAENNEAA
jgi:hypothetical protein